MVDPYVRGVVLRLFCKYVRDVIPLKIFALNSGD